MKALSKGSKRAGDDRDARGRWRKGHGQPGPGNPGVRRLAEHMNTVRDAIRSTCTTCRLKRVLRKLLELAEGGDVQASKIILDYCTRALDLQDLADRLAELERRRAIGA